MFAQISTKESVLLCQIKVIISAKSGNRHTETVKPSSSNNALVFPFLTRNTFF
jgi:hypothetical protein